MMGVHMVNKVLCVIFQTIPGGSLGVMLEMMLVTKNGHRGRWGRIFVWWLQAFVMSLTKIFMSNTVGVSVLVNVAWIISTVVFLALWYEEAFWKRIFAALCLYFVQCIGDLVGCAVVATVFNGKMTMDFAQPDMMFGCAFLAVFNTLTMLLTAMIWRRVQKKAPILRHSWMYFLVLSAVSVPIIHLMADLWSNGGAVDWGDLISTVIVFIVGVVLIFILFDQAEKDTIEKELEQTRYRFGMEQQHYQAVEVRREELAKIRHDYNDLLTSVLGLLRMGESRQAEEALEDLLARVGQTREVRYCGVPIVNALLSEKQELCDRQGIVLSADLLFPEDICVEPIDLCSVFSNLMDNAIRACGQLPRSDRRITLTAGLKGEHLVIRCENPAAKAPGPLPEGTGYGKRILRDIAQRWGGSFEAEYENGIHTATVILLEKGRVLR